LLSHFDHNIKNPNPDLKPAIVPHKIPIIGFSATFSRHDGLALGSVFERIVYHHDFLEMIKQEWYTIMCFKYIPTSSIYRLCNIRFTSVRANINLKEVTVSSHTGDFNPTSLAQVINTDAVNELVVRTWMDRACKLFGL
jgi:ATP-dependent helicase IRC3